jgi:hypothetical protein
MIQFSAAVESLLNQFTEYQTTHAKTFQQQLTATLASSNTTIAASPAKNDTLFAALDTPPLTPLGPSDHLQDDPAKTHAARDTHLTNSDRDFLDTGIDKYGGIDMDTTPQDNSVTIRQESASIRVDAMTIDGAKYTQYSPSQSSDNLRSISSGGYYYASTSESREHSSSPSTSKSTYSYRDHNSLPPPKSSTSTKPTQDREEASSHSPAPACGTLNEITPLKRKYNADISFPLPDFIKQLEEVFDCYPAVFKFRKDRNRVQYALRSMSKHVSRYFEPFLNKSISDNRNCLTRYSTLKKILQENFGTMPSSTAKIEARSRLSNLKQTGTMHNYITTIRDLATIDRWSETTILNAFKKGISPEVLRHIGDIDQIQSLSQLQVTAARAYSSYRNLPEVQKQYQLAKHSSSA